MKEIIIINPRGHTQQLSTNDLVYRCDEASDGYHTFDELYEHRTILFIALCKQISLFDRVFPKVQLEKGVLNKESGMIEGNATVLPPTVWRSQQHHIGGDEMYEGWFIMGINTEKGQQITYHISMDYWEETNFAETLENAPKWDKHKPSDVLDRIKKL